MRLMRRLMVVVRVVIGGDECNHDASFAEAAAPKNTEEKDASSATGANLRRKKLMTPVNHFND
jgi:hypothetical protein